MDYILDTHTFIWFMEGDSRLSSRALSIIEDTTRLKYVSVASLWEIGVKLSIGKLSLSRAFSEILSELSQSRITILPLALPHIVRVSNLELIHRDPFDRMIVAQAMEGNYTILGKDPLFANYNVNVVWD